MCFVCFVCVRSSIIILSVTKCICDLIQEKGPLHARIDFQL